MSKNTKKIIIGIVFMAIISRLGSAMAPSVVKIQQAFPTEDPTKVEFIVSIASFASMFSAIFFGRLLAKMTFKQVAAIGTGLMAFGGLMPLLVHNSINQLLAFAFIVGLGAGATTTVLPSLQAHIFSGKQLSGILGKVVAIENGASMFLMLIGGVLAARSWLQNYYVYFLSLITFIFVIWAIPNESPNEQFAEKPKVNTQQKNHPVMIIISLLIGMFAMLLDSVITNKMAIYLHTYHIGGPKTAGIALMFATGAAIVIGLLINPLRQLFKGRILAVAFLLMAIGALLFINVHSFFGACLAGFLTGSGSAIVLMTIPYMLASLTTATHFPLVMGSFAAITSLGYSFSVWFFRFTVPFFTDDLLNGTFIGMLLIASLIFIGLLVTNFQARAEKSFNVK